MCVLCSQIFAEVHWSERQLDPEMVSHGAGETARRQDRRSRTRLLSGVLAHYGLAINDDTSATNYVLGNRKGKSEVVASLAELWPAANAMAGRILDPLDGELLDRLNADAS